MKELTAWLHYKALEWRMPGVAHQHDLSGVWHKFEGSLPGWAHCGVWLADSHVRASAGKGHKRQSPWWGSGTAKTLALCPKCFHQELPLLTALVEGR
jgi:hypothetical protein